MSLANKYRPRTFVELLGQPEIIQIEKDLISRDVGNYIFAGQYGSGKTSLARIFAKSLNCYEEDSISPCGECNSCKSIDRNSSLYVREIDGGSFGKIDRIREILNEMQYNLGGNCTVYIIDEVQGMSKSAFEALLKVLEEPPKNVVFILLTTEIWKIPDTIKSRCRIVNFEKVDSEFIVQKLLDISRKEDIEVEEGALRLLANFADGSVRDAIKYLEQATIYNEAINESLIRQKMGLVGESEIGGIESYVINRMNIEEVLVILKKANYKFLFRNLLKGLFDKLISDKYGEDFNKLYKELVYFYDRIGYYKGIEAEVFFGIVNTYRKFGGIEDKGFDFRRHCKKVNLDDRARKHIFGLFALV